jgi:MarR family transcriptional regulator, transcriptional regulator for hemolysin
MQHLKYLGFSLTDAARQYMRCFQTHARQLGLDLRQCRTLVVLAANEGATQRRLAELTAIHAAAFSRVVDRMQACGWIERRLPPGRDRRAWSLAITQKGRSLLPLVRAIIDESQREAFSGLSANQLKLVGQALDSLAANRSARRNGHASASALLKRNGLDGQEARGLEAGASHR